MLIAEKQDGSPLPFAIASGGKLFASSVSFTINPTSGTVKNVIASDTDTEIQLNGCTFVNQLPATNDLTAVSITNEATGIISGGEIDNYQNAVEGGSKVLEAVGGGNPTVNASANLRAIGERERG